MIRVVSWNIEHGLKIDQAAEEIAATEELTNADIVLVQEMSPDGTAQLAKKLTCDFRYFATADHPVTGLRFGNAVLSRWPMGDTTTVSLPHTAPVQGQARSLTGTVVSVDGLRVAAVSVHIETVLLALRYRARQVEELAAAVTKFGELPTVVGGDFNTASRRSTRRFDRTLERVGLDVVSARGQATFHRFGRPFTLDHIYAKGLRCAASGVATGAEASDHLPIWATLQPIERSDMGSPA